MSEHGLNTTPWVDHVPVTPEVVAVIVQWCRDNRCYRDGVIFPAVFIKEITKVLKTFDAAGSSFGPGVVGTHHQRTVHLYHSRAIQPVRGPRRVYRIHRQVREYPVGVWM